ncbi:alkaline phosphatase family protein [Aphanothece sacrum]|uniref:Type I phosphodiesterase, nucleotide pyrophosphatase n=1 Tax=Aphanothece sacrum FPU1 TaxID=1920663 RepID=A0A401IFD5_APHSA|nr:alkaline phosphatase family protein [Aphanothece sacrum]GBF79934.1 type I phosphodiesterase, nucleotide pyrophosphatase [Aphanothece sacrum FPU1]GBF83846.1 type I phosphodiesterase [Aphanothece sacrum FPU3]
MSMLKKPVIAIGLDAAEPSLVEKWMEQGYLKNLSKLREKGIYGRLQNFDDSNVETAWTTFATGCSPQKTGFWAHMGLCEGTYNFETIAAYKFEEYPAFYSLGPDYRVATFDVPQVRLTDKINGVQVAAWGAHSPQVDSGSLPETLWQELIDKHGASPSLHKDYAVCLDLKSTLKIVERLKTSILRQSANCQDLLQREDWDLFLTVFNTPHAGGHLLWQLSQPDHPLYEALHSQVGYDPLLMLFQLMDEAIGEIVAKAPDNAHVVIFSAHGMGPATIDLPTFVALPEFLYRFNFPGQYALGYSKISDPLPPPVTKMKCNYWERHIWGTKYDTNPLRRFLRRELHNRIFKIIEPWLEKSDEPDLISPWELMRRGERVIPWNPTQWYKLLWPSMKAFALPSFAEGYIRINLKGREPQGIVEPSEYHALCDELCEKLYALKDARKGIPMVKKIVRTRENPCERHPKLPDPDLIVVWQDDYATDVIDSPDYGRCGPLPPYRAGSHRPEGMILAYGPEIEPGTSLSQGHVLDLAPTILSLMDAPIPEYLEGKPLAIRKNLALSK